MTGVVCLKLPGERVHRLSLIYPFLFPHSGLRKEKADTPACVLQRPTSADALLSTCLNERPPAARGCLKKSSYKKGERSDGWTRDGHTEEGTERIKKKIKKVERMKGPVKEKLNSNNRARKERKRAEKKDKGEQQRDGR